MTTTARMHDRPSVCDFPTSPFWWPTQPISAAYQAHFRAVLEELHGIPYNMVDLPLIGESRLLEAALLLLDLPLGEFTRPEVLKVLTHPAVCGRFPDADPERWRTWCLDLEVVRGADRDDQAGTYIDREVFHWDQGLRRLALGAFMTGPAPGDDRPFRLEGAEYSPFDQPADALADVARLLLLVRSLAADVRYARSARLDHDRVVRLLRGDGFCLPRRHSGLGETGTRDMPGTDPPLAPA